MPIYQLSAFAYDLDKEFLSFDEDYFNRKFHGTLTIPNSDDSYDILVRTGEKTKEGDYFIFCMTHSERMATRSVVLDLNEKSSQLFDLLFAEKEGEKIVHESIGISALPFIFEMLKQGDLATKNIIAKLSRRIKKASHKAAIEIANHLLPILRHASFSISEEMRLSDFSEKEITLIKDHSKGFYTIDQFLEKAAAAASGSVALGIRRHHILHSLSDVCRLVDYMTKIMDMYGDCYEHSDFVDRVSKEGKGIVFFVPRHVFTHVKSGATAREMRWLLEHPEALKETTFVFGAYDLISEENYQALVKTPPAHVPKCMKLQYKIEILETLFTNYLGDCSPTGG